MYPQRMASVHVIFLLTDLLVVWRTDGGVHEREGVATDSPGEGGPDECAARQLLHRQSEPGGLTLVLYYMYTLCLDAAMQENVGQVLWSPSLHQSKGGGRVR